MRGPVDGPFLDSPCGVIAKVPALKFPRALGALRIVVEGMDSSAEASRGKAEEPAATAHVQELLPLRSSTPEHPSERVFCRADSLLGQVSEKPGPVLTETESIS